MSTTVLVVEILIAGLGAMTWILLLTASIVGSGKVIAALLECKNWPEAVVTVLVLAIAYLLGLIMDRSADYVLSTPKIHSFLTHAARDVAKRDVKDMCTEIFVVEGQAGRWLTYIRGHLRIFRSAIFNAAAIALTGALLLWNSGTRLSAVVVSVIGAGASCWMVTLYAASVATYEEELAKMMPLIRMAQDPGNVCQAG